MTVLPYLLLSARPVGSGGIPFAAVAAPVSPRARREVRAEEALNSLGRLGR